MKKTAKNRTNSDFFFIPPILATSRNYTKKFFSVDSLRTYPQTYPRTYPPFLARPVAECGQVDKVDKKNQEKTFHIRDSGKKIFWAKIGLKKFFFSGVKKLVYI